MVTSRVCARYAQLGLRFVESWPKTVETRKIQNTPSRYKLHLGVSRQKTDTMRAWSITVVLWCMLHLILDYKHFGPQHDEVYSIWPLPYLSLDRTRPEHTAVRRLLLLLLGPWFRDLGDPKITSLTTKREPRLAHSDRVVAPCTTDSTTALRTLP